MKAFTSKNLADSAFVFFIALPFFIFSSCHQGKKHLPDVSRIKVSFTVERLENEFAGCKTEEQVLAFLNKHPLTADLFFERTAQGDSLLIKNILRITQSPSFDTLYHDCRRIWKDFSEKEAALKKSFTYVKYYFPDYTVPPIKTIITGFGRDLFASDSLIVIGLDFFPDEKTKYPPPLPDYIKKRYTPDHVVPYCMTAVSEKFNKTDERDRSLIADMVYYGKAYFFLEQVLPDVPEPLLIGYTEQELQTCEENAEVIWSYFIEKNLFYENNPSVTEKYVSERPFTSEIGARCPGRIGRWLGWRIVRKYMEKNENVTLSELMGETDAHKIFRLSGYKPSL